MIIQIRGTKVVKTFREFESRRTSINLLSMTFYDKSIFYFFKQPPFGRFHFPLKTSEPANRDRLAENVCYVFVLDRTYGKKINMLTCQFCSPTNFRSAEAEPFASNKSFPLSEKKLARYFFYRRCTSTRSVKHFLFKTKTLYLLTWTMRLS